MLYNVRRNPANRMTLRRIEIGGRLFNYHKYTNKTSALEYSRKVIKEKLRIMICRFN
jgi:hypothetical protein